MYLLVVEWIEGVPNGEWIIVGFFDHPSKVREIFKSRPNNGAACKVFELRGVAIENEDIDTYGHWHGVPR